MRDVTQLRDGSVVALDWEQEGDRTFDILRKIDFETGEFGETFQLTAPNVWNLYPAGNYPFDLLLDDGNHLFGYDLATGERTILLNWIEAGMAFGWNYHVGFLADGRISVLASDWVNRGGRGGRGSDEWSTELIVLTRIPRSELPERTVLTLGGTWFPDELRREVVAFNRESRTHQIQVVDYAMYSTQDDWRAGETRFIMDLATGRGPDIIVGHHGSALTDQGMLADLYPLLDADPLLDRSDFFSNILRAFEMPDGTLPLLSNAFGLQTMIGTAETAGDIQSWTLADLLALIDGRDATHTHIMGEWLTGENFIVQALMVGRDFIDWSERRVNLESEAFIDLLEVAARLPDAFPDGAGGWANEEFSRMRSGEQLLYMSWLSTPGRYQEFVAALDEIVVLGIPTEEGGAHVIGPSYGFGISAGSDHQDAAWDFIRRFFLPDAVIEWEFPLRIDKYEAQIAEAMTPMFWEEEDEWREGEVGEERPRLSVWLEDFTIDVFAMTEEEAAGLRAIIEDASLITRSDEGVWEIVQEELLAFFAGDRSAADTARILQNRIQTFLNERG